MHHFFDLLGTEFRIPREQRRFKQLFKVVDILNLESFRKKVLTLKLSSKLTWNTSSNRLTSLGIIFFFRFPKL